MRTIFWALVTTLTVSLRSSELEARETRTIGLGIILGEPTGFSAKWNLSDATAIDLALSYSFDEYFLSHGDFLLHYSLTAETKKFIPGEMRAYFGAGGGFGFSSKDRGDKALAFGRIPLGLEWHPVNPSALGVFMEIAPGLGFVPETQFLIYGGLGVRYYF